MLHAIPSLSPTVLLLSLEIFAGWAMPMLPMSLSLKAVLPARLTRQLQINHVGYCTVLGLSCTKHCVCVCSSMSTYSGDELLLTEMIFNGAFNDLSVQQCVALLSCFVFQERVCTLSWLIVWMFFGGEQCT